MTEKLPNVGRYPFMAEPFHCDFSHHLFMGHLGNDMLNAADYHSNDRNYGMNYLNTVNKTWVLSRLAIEMDEMPKAYDRFYIKTWVEGAMRFFTSRDFAVETADGRPLGYGKSIWAMIDTESRRPTDILKVGDGRIAEYVDTTEPCPIDRASRVMMTDDVPTVRTIDTYYNDVDVNGHINSIKYVEHILDLWNLDWYRQHHLRRLDIAYVAETHQGDKLAFAVDHKDSLEFNVRVSKITPDGTTAEVVRARVKFD